MIEAKQTYSFRKIVFEFEKYLKKINLEEIEIKKQEYMEMQQYQKDLEEDNSEDIAKTIKEFLSLKDPTPELMKVIINKIKLHQDRQIDIIFNFKELNKIW